MLYIPFFSANTSDFVIVLTSQKKPEKLPAVGLDDNGYDCNKQRFLLLTARLKYAKRRQIQGKNEKVKMFLDDLLIRYDHLEESLSDFSSDAHPKSHHGARLQAGIHTAFQSAAFTAIACDVNEAFRFMAIVISISRAFPAKIYIAAFVIAFSKRYGVRLFNHALDFTVLFPDDPMIITKHNLIAVTNAVISDLFRAILTHNIGWRIVMTAAAAADEHQCR